MIGTYLHGPLLPKNIWLADRLIELALGVELEPLPDQRARGGRARVGAARRRASQPVGLSSAAAGHAQHLGDRGDAVADLLEAVLAQRAHALGAGRRA